MEIQKTAQQKSRAGRRRASSDKSRAASAPPPEPYNPITEIKREKRWEQIFDVDGTLFDVRDARATKHGFDLLFGLPANTRLGKFIGGCRLIATPALAWYWQVHRVEENAVYDLPAGRTTLKRLRSRLGFNFFKDRRDLWKKRINDLKTLPTREVAERYDADFHVASDWRFLLVGRVLRPFDWWRHPAALAILRQPGLKLREIASMLTIEISHARRLRERALASDCKPLPTPADTPIAKVPYVRKPTHPPVKIENPFRRSRKQGQMFVGREFWKPGKTPRPKKIAGAIPAKPKKRGGWKHSHSQLTAKRTGQLLLPFKTHSGKKEAHSVIYQVQDFEGIFYDVYDVRPSKHGFALHFGFKTRAHRRLYTDKGKPGLIATPELVAFWKAHRTEVRANFDLPAGHTTLVRLRQRLGFHLGHDTDAVWLERIDDLKKLSQREFARKYQVPLTQVYKRRRSLVGPLRVRPGNAGHQPR